MIAHRSDKDNDDTCSNIPPERQSKKRVDDKSSPVTELPDNLSERVKQHRTDKTKRKQRKRYHPVWPEDPFLTDIKISHPTKRRKKTSVNNPPGDRSKKLQDEDIQNTLVLIKRIIVRIKQAYCDNDNR